MANYGIVFDEQRCIACHACEILCQQWKKSPMPACRIITSPLHMTPSRVELAIGFSVCLQCSHPVCVMACPTGALQQDDERIVLHKEKCTGCGQCLTHCPYQAIQQATPDSPIIRCDLCHDRTRHGELPACVAGCITGALRITDRKEELRQIRKQAMRCRKLRK